MKTIYTILVAGAASLLPSALADEPTSKEARSYAITISSEVSPLAEPDLRYPYMAASRGIEGSCSVTFTVSPQGKADSVRVGACTSDAFRRSAKSTVEQMRFAPRATARDGVTMRINWAFDEARIQTASIR